MNQDSDQDLAARLKSQVAMAALRGEKPVAELARMYGLLPAQIEAWVVEFERDAEPAFPPTIRMEVAPAVPASALPASAGAASPGAVDAPTLPEWPSGPKPPEPVKEASQSSLADEDWEGEAQAKAGAAGGRGPAGLLAGGSVPRGFLRGLFAPLVMGWRERRYAARASRELVELFHAFARANPDLPRREIYARVVMVRQRTTAEKAEEVLARASESFASWPSQRTLTFRDVVHYLAVSEFLEANEDEVVSTRENFGRLVMHSVPHDL
jgi:hypothetical protein